MRMQQYDPANAQALMQVTKTWEQREPLRVATSSKRGCYGNPAAQGPKPRRLWKMAAAITGVAIGIYALSPNLRYRIRHGHAPLPPVDSIP